MAHRNSGIVRDAMPPAIPRSVAPRLAWRDHLSWIVAIDVALTYAELRADGWTREAAAECAGVGFVRWLADVMAEGAETGIAFARSVEEEAA